MSDIDKNDLNKVTVKCPTCDKQVIWSTENHYRPFCSERCKILDLGDWASGKRFIPADAKYDDVTAGDLDKD